MKNIQQTITNLINSNNVMIELINNIKKGKIKGDIDIINKTFDKNKKELKKYKEKYPEYFV